MMCQESLECLWSQFVGTQTFTLLFEVVTFVTVWLRQSSNEFQSNCVHAKWFINILTKRYKNLKQINVNMKLNLQHLMKIISLLCSISKKDSRQCLMQSMTRHFKHKHSWVFLHVLHYFLHTGHYSNPMTNKHMVTRHLIALGKFLELSHVLLSEFSARLLCLWDL